MPKAVVLSIAALRELIHATGTEPEPYLNHPEKSIPVTSIRGSVLAGLLGMSSWQLGRFEWHQGEHEEDHGIRESAAAKRLLNLWNTHATPILSPLRCGEELTAAHLVIW